MPYCQTKSQMKRSSRASAYINSFYKLFLCIGLKTVCEGQAWQCMLVILFLYRKGLWFKAKPGKKQETLIWKITNEKRTGYMAQVVEHLPTKFKTLSSNLSTIKNKTSGVWQETHSMLSFISPSLCLLL
jgi:hypothetical protein